MKIAIISEQMIFPGGGDRLLLSVLKAFPDADVYTSVFFPQNYGFWQEQTFKNVKSLIKPNNLLLRTLRSKRLFKYSQKLISLLSPYLYENLDLRQYDLILSVSARYAKSVITPLTTKHINLYLTPPRYEWDKNTGFRMFHSKGLWGLLSQLISSDFRKWDFVSSRRPDVNYSISKYIAAKVKKYYGIDSEVIYPGLATSFVNMDVNQKQEEHTENADFFLVVSRLYDYKRIEWAIKACKAAGRKLYIIGQGPDEVYLKNIAARDENILFLGNVSDELIRKYYKSAQALLFCGVEDFGLVMIEALSQGCPVIGFNEGGASEIVIDGKSGELFSDYEDLVEVVKAFDKKKYKQSAIMSRANEFSEKKFIDKLQKIVQEK